MFSEILKIKPQVDAADLNKMERSLTSRFAKVAKGFGGGLLKAVKGGALVGAAISLVDKILNPLQAVQEAIDKTLAGADDVVTNAQQFNTTAGKLFKLRKFAEATGLDNSGLDTLMIKYQGALAESKADPSKPSAVKNFANDKDIAESFFSFIQSLNKMDREQQVLVQKEVFGEKQTLKMADFLRTDFSKLNTLMGLRPAGQYDQGLEKLGGLNDLKEAITASTTAEDTYQKSRTITQGMVLAKAQADQRALQEENKNIADYNNLKAISKTADEIMYQVQAFTRVAGAGIAKLIPAIEAIANSRLIRGILPGGK